MLNQDGRPVPVPRIDDYLAAYAAGPGADPGQLYAGIEPHTAGEHAFPGKDRLTARARAADRAARTRDNWHIYAHGQALVCTSREPDGGPYGGPYFTVTPAGQWSAHGGAPFLPAGRPPEQSQFISLISQTRRREIPPAAAPAGGEEPPAGSLVDLAAAHGLYARVHDRNGTTAVFRSEVRAGQPVLRQDYPGGPLLNEPGRIIPEKHAAAYLAAAARDPALTADDLYRQVIPGAAAGEDAWPRSHGHISFSHAAIKAREDSRPWAVYADGQAAVAAPQPPASGAAYYLATPAGQDMQWTRHLHGETEPVTHHLRPQDLSVIAGETAAAPAPAATQAPPGQQAPPREPGTSQNSQPPGRASGTGSTLAGQPAADWTTTHPHAAADRQAPRNLPCQRRTAPGLAGHVPGPVR